MFITLGVLPSRLFNFGPLPSKRLISMSNIYASVCCINARNCALHLLLQLSLNKEKFENFSLTLIFGVLSYERNKNVTDLTYIDILYKDQVDHHN